MKHIYSLFILLILQTGISFGQNFNEILGRPTSESITISILFDQKVEVYWDYGTTSGTYNLSTQSYVAAIDTPLVIDLTSLSPNTKYYYRVRYRIYGSTADYIAGLEHCFHTHRLPGNSFTFAIEADPHLDYNSDTSSFSLTLKNILSANPDFMLDLGDTFMSEKLPVINQTEVTNRYILFRRYFGQVSHSVPLYLVNGNHEGELGWMLNGSSNSFPVMAANIRKYYYPNPIPNTFYSGNSKPEEWVGLLQNYYAWEWGDALFIVLDPYWYTTVKLNWGWTLGQEQYNWFRNTLTSSKAKFKFVFCHNLVGGNTSDARGGAEYADLFEMGGKNSDLSWGFDANRPNWGKPLHTLMVENGPAIFFHGHDHLFAKQDKVGVVYQEVPQPSTKNIVTCNAAQWGYVNGVFLPNRGYLLVTVSDTAVKVDYIRTYLPSEENTSHVNQEVAYSYTIKSKITSINLENNSSKIIQLEQNYPNPFNSKTSIGYKITEANNVTLKVYDILGREISTLVNQFQTPGEYTASFNVSEKLKINGIYFYQLTVGNKSKTMKMIRLNPS